MASLCKRCRHPRESWDSCGCQWLIRRQVNGRVVYTKAGNTRAAAERELARLDVEAQETVSEAVERFIEGKARDPNARPNSLHAYRSRAKHLDAFFGDMRVIDVRPEHLIRFVDEQLEAGRAPATVQGLYALLTASLRGAVRRGVIRHLPLPPEGPKLPAVAARDHALSLADVERVIARMPGVWGRVAELILLTGLRWGEAVALEPGDVEGHVLRVRRTRNRYGGVNRPKTKSGERVVPLSRDARAILEHLELPVSGDYRRAHDALVHALGDLHRPGMGWHVIRNAHAALLDAAGVSLRDQASRMGHGVHFAQTLAYGLRSQAGSADALDAVRQHASRPSSGSPAPVARLDEARARRREAP